MLKTHKTKLALLLVLLALVSAGPVWADSLTVEIDLGAVVYNADSSDARLLLEFAVPEALLSARIKSAELYVPIEGTIPDTSILTLYCRPLLISWQPGYVDWEDLGDSPDTSIISYKGTHFGTAQSGPQTAYFDITRVIKRWQSRSLTNNGLALYVNPHQRPRFTCPRQGNEPFATARIIYEPPVN